MKQLYTHLTEALKRYENISDKEIENRIMSANKNLISKWEDKKSVIEFYTDAKDYIYDLIFFNDPERVMTLLYPIRGINNKDILEFGAGLGELGMQLSEHNSVYYFDINKEIEQFARYLSKGTKRKITFLKNEEEIKDRMYDVLIVTDVLEHLEEPVEKLKELSDCLKQHGLILTTGLDFSVGEKVPFHLKSNLDKKEEYNEYMFTNFNMLFFHVTKNETIYVWRKR